LLGVKSVKCAVKSSFLSKKTWNKGRSCMFSLLYEFSYALSENFSQKMPWYCLGNFFNPPKRGDSMRSSLSQCLIPSNYDLQFWGLSDIFNAQENSFNHFLSVLLFFVAFSYFYIILHNDNSNLTRRTLASLFVKVIRMVVVICRFHNFALKFAIEF